MRRPATRREFLQNAAALCWSGGLILESAGQAIVKKSGARRADSVLDHTARNGRQVKGGGLAVVWRYIAVIEFLGHPVAASDLIPAHLWFDEFELASGTS